MITRSNLAEQLREYQIRSKHDWASVSFFSSTSTTVPSSRTANMRSMTVQLCVDQRLLNLPLNKQPYHLARPFNQCGTFLVVCSEAGPLNLEECPFEVVHLVR